MVLTLRVFRWSPEAGERVDELPAGVGPGTTVLDALVHLRETRVPDLAFRYACRVGMCGSCAVVVNGRERWACRTRLATVAGAGAIVTIRPLYHFPLIRDLVVDMTPFVEKMRQAGAVFVPAEPPPAGGGPVGVRPPGGGGPGGGVVGTPPPDVNTRQVIDGAIECIGCGACVSACTLVRWNPRFLGPAALNRAFTLIADRRDAAGLAGRWPALLGEDGVLRCHGQAQCTAVCPMALSPTDSILRLRRKAAGSLFLRT
jgi:fumarate reductase iron-sulfur subunit